MGLFEGERSPRPALAKKLFFSTVASVLIILLLQKTAIHDGRQASLVAFNLIFFGVLMFMADYFSIWGGRDMCQRESRGRAIFIGIAQALAIFPGVSRSGITLTAGRLLGLSRKDSTHYSFLLSLPIIFGGVLKELLAIYRGEDQTTMGLGPILLGMALAFVVGMITIHLFLKLIERWGLGIFTLYRLLLGGSSW